MRKKKLWSGTLLGALFMLAFAFTANAGTVSRDSAAEAGKAELQYWSEGSPAAASIKEYVEAAVDEESAGYIPVEDRIAVFDLDGTIIGELHPSYFEYMMFIHRALYDDDYTAPEDVQTFAEALEEGIETGKMPKNHETLHAKYAGEAYSGMTPDELKEYTKSFMNSRADGFGDLTRGEAFYKPMVSLVEYLDANDFQCYIVSGSDRSVVRGIIDGKLPIPPNRVIGMSYSMVASGQQGDDGLDYVYTKDDEVILGGDLLIKTIKMNKVSEIALEIGKVPVLSFGNSSGDLSMAQYIENNEDYEGRAYMVLCDDLTREHGNKDKADSMRKTCEESGFDTISMRDDFATIYGEDVEVTDYEYDEAAFDSEAAAAASEAKEGADSEGGSGVSENEAAGASENVGDSEEAAVSENGADSEEAAVSENGAAGVSENGADSEDAGASEDEAISDNSAGQGESAQSLGSSKKFKGAEADYIEKDLPIFRDELTNETISVRYYDDMPNVPYVGIKEYYDRFMEDSLSDVKETMSVEKSGSTYFLKNPYGEAEIDVNIDVLSSDDFVAFTNLMSLTQAGMDNGYSDGIPYVRVKAIEREGDASAALDFGRYGIDIREGDGDVYFPESTLSDIFSDLAYHLSVCNGETFYFFQGGVESIADIDPDYAKPIMAKLDKDFNRPEDLAEFAYSELLFSIENFYGMPGRAIVNDDMAEVGLEEALKEYGAAGEKTLELLKSRSFPEYLFGYQNLQYFLNDGGHTIVSYTDLGNAENDEINDAVTKLSEEYGSMFSEAWDESSQRNGAGAHYLARIQLQDSAYGEEKYIKSGDTAVYVLDSFMGFNMDALKSYYEGKGKKPTSKTVSGDDILHLQEALEDADRDPAIKNFVIDCSNNTGGSLDEVAMLCSMITGQREISFNMINTLTGQKITETYEADTNMDKSFDEKDQGKPYDLNFAVLTSASSFSCGNAFPSFMKDAGYMVMGEQSGGGSCAVMVQTTGEGITYRMSSYRALLTDKNWENIDDGIPVDVDLVPKRSDGRDKFITVKDVEVGLEGETEELRVPDYSDFYNIDRLSEEMNAFYGKN